jgi:PAS domain S-box-containing protein
MSASEPIGEVLSGLPRSPSESRMLIDAIPALALSTDTNGSVNFINERWHQYTGLSVEESHGSGWQSAIHPEDLPELQSRWDGCRETVPDYCEVRLRRSDGVFRWFSLYCEALRKKDGSVSGWLATATDIESMKQREMLHEAEERTLELIANGASLDVVLDQLCSSIDIKVVPSITVIMLRDFDLNCLRRGAGSRVPNEWMSKVYPVPVAFDAGLCGTAAYLKQRVIVSDVVTEPNWPHQFRDLAIRNGIRAGWSEPILTKDDEVIGTFAFYSHEARVPTEEDLALIQGAGHIARIAIERQRSQESLRTALEKIQSSEAKLRRVIDTIPTLAWCSLPDGQNEFVNRRWHEYTGL